MSAPERSRPNKPAGSRQTLSELRKYLQEPVRAGRHELPRWTWGIPVLAAVLTIGVLQLVQGAPPKAADDPAEVSIRAVRAGDTPSTGERAIWEKQSAAWLLSHANHLMERGEAARAEPLLRLAVEKAPGHSSVLFGLGVCLLKQGKAKAAIPPLFEASRLEPQHWQPQERLAEAFRAVGDDRSARKAAGKARSLRYPRLARARPRAHEETPHRANTDTPPERTEPQPDTPSPAPTEGEPRPESKPGDTPNPGESPKG